MSTVATPPAPAIQSVPLSDSLMSLIDQAHAEPGKSEQVDSSGVLTPPTPTQPVVTPPLGKADAGKDGVPSLGDKTPAEKKADDRKLEKAEVKKDPDQSELFKKRLNEQTAVNSRLGRELKEAKEQIQVLQQQIAGTYQPPTEPTAEETARMNEFRGKEVASRRMASEKYGETFVNSQIYDPEAPFQQLVQEEPWQYARVARADHPVEEALRILKERQVYEELGPDPYQWELAITEKVREKIMKEFQQQQADASALTGKPVPSVGEGRSASDARESVKAEEDFSLSALGGHFLT